MAHAVRLVAPQAFRAYATDWTVKAVRLLSAITCDAASAIDASAVLAEPDAVASSGVRCPFYFSASQCATFYGPLNAFQNEPGTLTTSAWCILFIAPPPPPPPPP